MTVEFQICMYDSNGAQLHYFPKYEIYNGKFSETNCVTTIFIKWKLKYNLSNLEILEVWYYDTNLIMNKPTWKIILDHDDRVIGSFCNMKSPHSPLFKFIIKYCEAQGPRDNEVR
ncbi:hypothetical protein RclHR1_01550035 [Rhizophagus clarus]|uniref:Uncharacterized protein n=1 Tax=Rhizophagus clarus TaxID=94130 RepID=A0A2Z6QW13_9GLOM|nr:hypothetical protein RclHR1_01550035 [Rhizophagus clarus]GET03460.1 hypothetical protein RCL_jg22426.t1 [Rhizophagus clarus]